VQVFFFILRDELITLINRRGFILILFYWHSIFLTYIKNTKWFILLMYAFTFKYD